MKKISDLEGQSEDLTLYGSPECRQRLDCLLGLQKVYGLEFKKFTPVAIDLRHEVLDKGQADLSIVFTTDPQVKRNNEVLLEDDKGMFPPYNTMFLVRDDVVQEAGPDLRKVVDQINKGLTDPVMSELNARVDLDKKTPEQVAGEYLNESGLVQYESHAAWEWRGGPRFGPPRSLPRIPAMESVWDYPRPPRVEPCALPARVEFGGRVVAESSAALRVLETSQAPAIYLPPADVDMTMLRPAARTTYCEWKGRGRLLRRGGRRTPLRGRGVDLPAPGPGLRGHPRPRGLLPPASGRVPAGRRARGRQRRRLLRRLDHERHPRAVQGSPRHRGVVRAFPAWTPTPSSPKAGARSSSG